MSLTSLKNQARTLLGETPGVNSVGTYWNRANQPVLRVEVNPNADTGMVERRLQNLDRKDAIVRILISTTRPLKDYP
jgi:hypothetical protein